MDDVDGALITRQFGMLSEVHGTPVGIDIPDFTNLNDAKEFLRGVAKLRGFPSFVVGDTFLKLVALFGEAKGMADTLIEVTGYNPKYVRTCADVVGKVPRLYRRIGLSFEHHAAVAKVKGNGCETHAGNLVSDQECGDCQLARYREIANWLETAEKKKWSAKELKEQIGSGRSTTVREHQRNLDGKDFDPEAFGEIVSSARASCGNLYDALTVKNLLNKKKDAIDRGAAKGLISKIAELRDDMDALEKAIGEEVE